MDEEHAIVHARILPSCLLKWTLRGLWWASGEIKWRELFDWKRPALSQEAETYLRASYVMRIRPGPSGAADQPIGFAMPVGRPDGLNERELELVQFIGVAFAGERLARSTIRQVKTALQLSYTEVFKLLAYLESLSWSRDRFDMVAAAFQAQTQAAQLVHSGNVEPPINQSAQWIAMAHEVLGKAWVNGLQPDDVRFSDHGPLPLRERLQCALRNGGIDNADAQLVQKLQLADSQTWALELEAVIQAVHDHPSFERVSDMMRAQRIEILRRRFGGLKRQSLGEAAKPLGLSAERARHYAVRFFRVLNNHSCKMPALEKVLSAVAAIAPVDVDEANQALVDLLGDGHGVLAACAFAQEVGMPLPFRLANSQRLVKLDG